MDKNLKVMNRELREGKNLEENLPGFLNKMAGVYHRYAMLELAMRYPAYYEAIRDGEITPAEEDWKLVDALNVLIRENLKEKFDGEGEKASIIAVNDIRKKAVRRMSVLTAYTDRLSLKEYILNRLEYCYKDDALGDPMVNDYHILAMGYATKEDLDTIADYTFRIPRSDVLLPSSCR